MEGLPASCPAGGSAAGAVDLAVAVAEDSDMRGWRSVGEIYHRKRDIIRLNL
jgi:hypothetical protein